MLFSTVNENQWPFTYSTFSITRHNTFRNGTLLHHLCSVESLQLHCQLKWYRFAHKRLVEPFWPTLLCRYIYCDMLLLQIYNLFYTYVCVWLNCWFGTMRQLLTVDSACLDSYYPIGLFVILSKEQKEDTIFDSANMRYYPSFLMATVSLFVCRKFLWFYYHISIW